MSELPPLDTGDTQVEELPQGSGPASWLFPLMHLAVGVTAIGLAISPGFAAGKADFSSGTWKVILGLVGAGLTLLAARAVVRTIANERVRLTPELRKRARLNGAIVGTLGAFLVATSLVSPIAERTVSFASWAKLLFAVGGIYLVLLALLIQWNPTKSIRKQRVQRGQGVPGTARIVRANDTGVSVNDEPQVKIEFDLSVDGQSYSVSDKIVMQRAKLALLIPGSTVKVLVDRADPNVFHIDWDSWQPPSGLQPEQGASLS